MPDLVIAEKPSVAQAIAAVLGSKERKDGFLMGNGYIVSSTANYKLAQDV